MGAEVRMHARAGLAEGAEGLALDLVALQLVLDGPHRALLLLRLGDAVDAPIELARMPIVLGLDGVGATVDGVT